jgi:signal transduction histidine kinase
MIAVMSNYVPGDGISGTVFQTGEPIAVEDARYANPPANIIAEAEGIYSVLSVPLKIGDKIFGVFGMDYCRPRTFSDADKRLFKALAQRAARAIENARLYEQAEQAAALQERQRLARELHDSVTQSLYSLMLMAGAGRRLADGSDLPGTKEQVVRIGETAQQALKEMRLMVYEMRPLGLHQVGLVEALRQRLDAVEKRAGIQTRLEVDGEISLPAALEEELYRIAQEALNNSLKHAASTLTVVRVQAGGDNIMIEVSDNGKGFILEAEGNSGGMGLENMWERAENIGANLTVLSGIGQGTTVRVAANRSTPSRQSPPEGEVPDE